MSTRICPKCGFATLRAGPSAWECGRVLDCGYKEGDKAPSPADADAEMREAMAVILARMNPSFVMPLTGADAILAELRRRGCIFPGDPVTDEMAAKACHSFESSTRYLSSLNDMRAAIINALASPRSEAARKA